MKNITTLIKALQEAGANGRRSLSTPVTSRKIVERMPAPGSRCYDLEEITQHPNATKLKILDEIRNAVNENLPKGCSAEVFIENFNRVPINLPVWVEIIDEDEHTTISRIKLTRDKVYNW